MRLQVMSDLHIKHWGAAFGVNYWSKSFPQETQTDAEVLVLAGDIVDLGPRDWRWSMARLQEFVARYKQVVYVPGNHEFYATSIAAVDLVKVAQDTGVSVLQPGTEVVIGRQRFLGGVMFQPKPIEGLDDLPNGEMPNPISDHWCISDFDTEAPYQYQALRSFLEDRLTEEHIVVTHHAPSNGSLAAQWVGDPCNWWFITHQMESLIDQFQPKLWVHGHVHSPWDYQRGKTRIIANPKGYPGEGVRFNPKLVVEVS